MTARNFTLSAAAGIAALSLLTTPQAFANHDTAYFAIERTALFIDSSSGPQHDEISPTGFRLRMGASLSHAFDVEAQFGGGSDDDTGGFDDFKARYAGAYLKGYLPLGYRSSLFGLGGFSYVELTESIDRIEFNDSRTGFSYGFGLETQITKNVDLSADYMRYSQEDGIYDEISAVNFGVKIYF